MDRRQSTHPDAHIVLASASPRRRDLLRLLGVPFHVWAADVDETPHHGEGAEAMTMRLARSKALAVSVPASSVQGPTSIADTSQPKVESRRDNGPQTPGVAPFASHATVVLAADTTVVLGDRILGKPVDDAEAVGMLQALRGRPHRVLTGVALAVAGAIQASGVVGTTVWMRPYGDDEIERYVRSGVTHDRAGAYGIQDRDLSPVDRIEGCLANVVGLPLCYVRQTLTALDPTREWAPGWTAAAGEAVCYVCERALDSISQRPT